jgi:hypothetical protein
MEDSSRTYDADGNRTDNTNRPRNISQSVQAEIAARHQAANQNVVPPAAANANENQGQLPGEAAPNNNIPSPSPTGANALVLQKFTPPVVIFQLPLVLSPPALNLQPIISQLHL